MNRCRWCLHFFMRPPGWGRLPRNCENISEPRGLRGWRDATCAQAGQTVCQCTYIQVGKLFLRWGIEPSARPTSTGKRSAPDPADYARLISYHWHGVYLRGRGAKELCLVYRVAACRDGPRDCLGGATPARSSSIRVPSISKKMASIIATAAVDDDEAAKMAGVAAHAGVVQAPPT